MRFLVLLAIAVTAVASFAQKPDCEFLLETSPLATKPLERLSDGRWLATLDYSTEKAGVRLVELPSSLAALKGQSNLKVVVLAGNSGTQYEMTRHSLAHSFGDYLLREVPNWTHESNTNFVSRETVSVSYDDGTARSWTTDFRTQVPQFRTVSGEVFYFPALGDGPVLVVKMIGDYNEVGDFAIPILDGLGLPPKNLILIHDDLTLAEAQTQIASGLQKYNGNNAVFSLIRSLAYGALPRVVQFLKSKATLPEEQWKAFEEAFRAKADVRYPGHLGQERAYDSAFKNVDSVLAALTSVVPDVEKQITSPMKVRLEDLRKVLSEAKRPMAAFMPELNNPATAPERKAELAVQRDQILAASKPAADQVKTLEAEIQAVRKELIAGIRAIVETRLTFSRLAIGTDNGAIDRSDLPGFVLAPYPRDIFTDEIWARVALDLKKLTTKE